jgi:hypothetical protein
MPHPQNADLIEFRRDLVKKNIRIGPDAHDA